MRALEHTHISDGTLFMALQHDPFRSVLLVLLPFFSFSVDLFCRFSLVAFFTHTLYRLVFYVPPGRLERCSRAAFVRSLLLRPLLRYTIGAARRNNR